MDLEQDVAAAPPQPGGRPSLSAEDRFARVIEALPIALVLAAPGGSVEMVNRRTEIMFGYNSGQMRGKRLDDLMPGLLHRQIEKHAGIISSLASPMDSEARVLTGLRKDATRLPLELDLHTIDFDGVPMMLAGIIDVTVRHETQREMERQQQELKRSNADLEEFAYAASHDLKAPLRAIAHLAQWIGEDIAATAGPDTLENLGLLQSRVQRLQSLLDGLLAYSRVGRTPTPVEDVDIAETVHDIVALLAPPPGFVVACEGTLPVIRTHRMPIQVVLRNLIENGLKHHDRAEGRVTVAMRLADGVAEFRVSDDGPGIDPRFHDRIFLIFQTLASRDDVEASGIGLAIVKKKVQRHGGQIRVESAPPARGTSFVFTWREEA
jgi:PAS domain S-box-containing protein